MSSDLTIAPPRRPNLKVIDGDKITRENFFKKGLEMIQKMYPDGAPTIKPGMAEYDAWVRYFDVHLGWRPWAIKAMEERSLLEMTVPAQWPEWFDPSYVSR